ncbi:PilZ domain-containing protein [Desulfosarcina ovata]|uniref:PilZ domain-containing protein n=1 Tax=Desulfosarcina ovata TaxID=83564 RepID=UPI0039C9BABF
MVNAYCQRACARDPVEASISCQPYASTGGMGVTNGVMRNFSSQGFYIETNKQFDSGTILFVRTTCCFNRICPTACRQPRTICLAEVRWLRHIDDGNTPLYGMGARYLD